MRTKVMIPAIVVVVVIVATIAGYYIYAMSSGTQTVLTQSTSSSSVATSSSTSTSPSGNSPSTVYVFILGSGGSAYFSPSNVVITVNSTVVWENEDSIVHSVIDSNNASVFGSGDINAGGTWSFTFTNPGTYLYYCSYHPWMTGTVVVNQG